MKEFIERKAVVMGVLGLTIVDPMVAQYADAVLHQIQQAPAADVVERKRGEWVFKHPNGWACSECGEWGLMVDNRGICKSDFCPNCGADMRGNNHETDIEAQPTVDVVEVVRCKDCKHRDPENNHCDHVSGTMIYFPRKPDDFCSYGERRNPNDHP